MSKFSIKSPDRKIEVHGALSHLMFTPENTPVDGFSACVNVVQSDQYPQPGIHDDNEGFYVVRGTGWAKVGDEEQPIAEGSCFFAPAGIPHAIRKDSGAPDLEVFLFHFPK